MDGLFHLSSKFLEELQIVSWAYTEKMQSTSFLELEKWVEKELHGNMRYLEDERKDLRKDLREFFPECKSALVFLFDYTHAAKKNIEEGDFKLASYVKGFEGYDYHHWIKEKLNRIAEELNLSDYKLSIDTQPVLERDLAYRAGLGWFGKNSMLINKKHGSFFIIASLLLESELELPSLAIETDHCGTCTRCIDACPTNAIVGEKIIDAKKCISYFTIENFKETPRPKEFSEEQPEIFGCDICQTVCPWNSKPLKRVQEKKENERLNFFKQDLESISEQLKKMSNREFRRKFKGTPLERTGRVGVLKNIALKD